MSTENEALKQRVESLQTEVNRIATYLTTFPKSLESEIERLEKRIAALEQGQFSVPVPPNPSVEDRLAQLRRAVEILAQELNAVGQAEVRQALG
jgi:archaellum component FlaC